MRFFRDNTTISEYLCFALAMIFGGLFVYGLFTGKWNGGIEQIGGMGIGLAIGYIFAAGQPYSELQHKLSLMKVQLHKKDSK